MAVLTKPVNAAFVIHAERKDEFIRATKNSNAFEKLMARSANVKSTVNITFDRKQIERISNMNFDSENYIPGWRTYEVNCDDGTFEDVIYEWVKEDVITEE